jgi:hypothetical protein
VKPARCGRPDCDTARLTDEGYFGQRVAAVCDALEFGYEKE